MEILRLRAVFCADARILNYNDLLNFGSFACDIDYKLQLSHNSISCYVYLRYGRVFDGLGVLLWTYIKPYRHTVTSSRYWYIG